MKSEIGIQSADCVAQNHPLRSIRYIADESLRIHVELSGQPYPRKSPSMTTEQLLRAALLQSLYSIGSIGQLAEQLQYNTHYRWFVGLADDEPGWTEAELSAEISRLLQNERTGLLLSAIIDSARASGSLSDRHFRIDGARLQEWEARGAALKPVSVQTVRLATKPDRQPLRPVERACADFRPATTQAKVSSIYRTHSGDADRADLSKARPAQIMVSPPPRTSQDTRLTERQIDVLRELSQGKTNKLIARELGISEGTVKIHLAAIFRALCVQNRTEAAIMARQLVGSRDNSPEYVEVKSA